MDKKFEQILHKSIQITNKYMKKMLNIIGHQHTANYNYNEILLYTYQNG